MTDVLVPSAVNSIPIHAVTRETLPGILDKLGAAAGCWAQANGYDAENGAILCVPDAAGALAAVLFADDSDAPPDAAGALAGTLPARTYRLEGFADPQAATRGFALGSYAFHQYRRRTKAERPRLVVPAGVDGDALKVVLDGVTLARDLINTPANDLGPAELARAAEDLAAAHGAAFTETIGEDLLDQGFPMIHAVGKASTREPRLVDICWGYAAHPKLTLVGKGVCFDTGGLDIKPPSGMLLMKKDMGGAANVLGLAAMIMAARLPVRLRVLIPAVENSIAGNAFRPGDILPSRKGINVEIGNTDAEGRLVLADALTLADEERPDLIIDMATLTGAARVALGPELAPFYTDDETLAAAIAKSALEEGDPVWRMPLWKSYKRLLESRVADINHISSGPFAGSITAALFLARFVEKATWAHFDIYGWNASSRPGHPEGGEAHGIRALFAALAARYASGARA